MKHDCQQFKLSRQGLLHTDPFHLEAFFRELVPDEQFRFITFQATDFRYRNVTCLLYNYIPESVFVVVEQASDIQPAIDELALLNPGVEWSGLKLKNFDQDSGGRTCITIELLLESIPMRVSASGMLITL